MGLYSFWPGPRKSWNEVGASQCRRHLGKLYSSLQGLPLYARIMPYLLCTYMALVPLHGIVTGPCKNPISTLIPHLKVGIAVLTYKVQTQGCAICRTGFHVASLTYTTM